MKQSSSVSRLCVTILISALIIANILSIPNSICLNSPNVRLENEESALNILDGSIHKHHPVLTVVSQKMYPVEDGYITELNGLKVPQHFDCDPLNNGTPWGPHPYYTAFAPRWQQCHLHIAHMISGETAYKPELPIIDEEYFETVATYDIVHKAVNRLVIVELGARWGTWGARALALWRRIKTKEGNKYNLLFIESDKRYCEGLRQVMTKNQINYTLLCQKASPVSFLRWTYSVSHVDLLHIDIQGAELYFLTYKDVRQVLEKKVKRIIIGTHSVDIHMSIGKLFSGWIKVHELQRQEENVSTCAWKTFRERTNKEIRRTSFEKIISMKCYEETGYGKIAHGDGELILDNPVLMSHQPRLSFP